jgi:hypothetical protein
MKSIYYKTFNFVTKYYSVLYQKAETGLKNLTKESRYLYANKRISILSQLNELLNESFIISVCPSTSLNMAAGLDAYRLGLASPLEAEANDIYQLVRYDLDQS